MSLPCWWLGLVPSVALVTESPWALLGTPPAKKKGVGSVLLQNSLFGALLWVMLYHRHL